jgi:hypothetical protein
MELAEKRVPASCTDCLAACELESHDKASSLPRSQDTDAPDRFFLLDIVLIRNWYLRAFLSSFKSHASIMPLNLH